jgi:phosphoribosyl isomerase A
MGFEVIPAIDVAGQRLARFTRAGPVAVEAFGGDPLAAAAAFVAAGASRLHVVDMDLAFDLPGARNIDVVAALHANHPATRIQVSGGLVRPPDLEEYLDAGAERVVLGSSALADPAEAKRIVATLGDKVVIGLEVDGDRIRPRGASDVDLPLDDTLGWLTALPARRYAVTAVARVGALTGPDLRTLERVIPVLGRPVIAAGGVATQHQVRSLAALGVEGVVLGTLLYEHPEMAGVLIRLAEVLRG